MSIGSIGQGNALSILSQDPAQSPAGSDAAFSIMKKALDSADSTGAALAAQIDQVGNEPGQLNVYA